MPGWWWNALGLVLGTGLGILLVGTINISQSLAVKALGEFIDWHLQLALPSRGAEQVELHNVCQT